MARIRSIHPDLPSDEAFMSMSMEAKVAWPLIWTQCDDNGIFEWKAIVLKARIFPANNVDFERILEELLTLNAVRKFSIEGKHFGAVRNFRRWQRPQKPNCRFPFPDEIRKFVGERYLKDDSGSVPVSAAIENGRGFAEQREEEGGTMDDEGGMRTEGDHHHQQQPDTVVDGGFTTENNETIAEADYLANVYAITGLQKTAQNKTIILQWLTEFPVQAIEWGIQKVSMQRNSKGDPPPQSAKYFEASIKNEVKFLQDCARKLADR